MLSSDASYTATYNYSDADGNYTGLLQSETKTLPEAENLPLIPDANIQVTLYTYDANGNQLTVTDYEGHVKNYAYDGLNQLISYSDEKNTASYTYRMDGMRRSKTVNGTTITHIWVGGQIVADVTGNYTATCYVRGTNLLAQYGFNYGASDNYTYYLQNAHGDVTALLDTAGELTKSYVYDAFGVEQNIDNSDSNAFRYCGEYYDAETGTVYLRARYYNPVTGRFISRDSYTGEHGDPLSLNLYTYCVNNPLIYWDPSGHKFSFKRIADGFSDIWDSCKDAMHKNVERKKANWRFVMDETENFVDAVMQASSFEIGFGVGFGGSATVFSIAEVEAEWVIWGERERHIYEGVATEQFDKASIGIGALGLGLFAETECSKLTKWNFQSVYGASTENEYSVGLQYGDQTWVGYSNQDPNAENTLSIGVSGYFILGAETSFAFNASRFEEALHERN